MCTRLAVKLENSKSRTAYKVMIKMPNRIYLDEGRTNIVSPFHKYPMTIRMLKGSERYAAEYRNAQPYIGCAGTATLDRGYVHSYACMEDAAAEIRNFYDKQVMDDEKVMLFECEIPLGPGHEDNECWMGKFDSSMIDNYASRYLIFKREVPREEFESYLTHEA